MARLWPLLLGYVRIEISGHAVERFINLATSSGVFLRNIRRGPASLQADVSIRGFRALRPIARKTHSRVRIKAKRGLPFAVRRGRGRYGFVAGLAACLLAVMFVASRVWFVDVSGLEDPARASEVRRIAAECGLKPGAMLAALDMKEIELGILSSAEYVSWVRLKIQGTRVIVDVIEKTLPPTTPAEETSPCDLVAAQPGTIVRMIVYMGEPVAREGDEVAQGQVLIEGRIKGPPVPTPPGQPPQPNPPTMDKPVHARGQVTARVVRTVSVEEPLVQWVKQRTGRTYTRSVIRLPGRDIIWKGRQPVPFAETERVFQARALRWRNIPLPVESITETFFEVVPVKSETTRDEARVKAREKAFSSARARVPAGADITDISAESKETDSAVHVTVTIKTLEDIGVPSVTR